MTDSHLAGVGTAVSRVLATSRRSAAAALRKLSPQAFYHSTLRSTATAVLALALVATAPGTAAVAAAATSEGNPYSDPTQCVYLAWDLAADAGHGLPNFGDAHSWRQGAIDHGYRVLDTLSPEAASSVAVWDSYVGGTGWAGHVAWVTAVRGDEFFVKERNWVRATDTGRWVKWQEGISFIVLEEETPAEVQAADLAGAPTAGLEVAAVPAPQGPSLREVAREERWSRALRGELVDAARPDRAARGEGDLRLPDALRELLAAGEPLAGPIG